MTTTLGRSPERKAKAAHRWELLTCGRRGHLTYAPDDSDVADRLHAETTLGEAWRCLRCGDFVLGEPSGRGRADDAPVPARGAELREEFVMRFLALERLIRALILWAIAYGVHSFDGSKESVQKSLQHYLPALNELAREMHISLADAAPMRLVDKALATNHRTLVLVTCGLALYGLIEAAECVGLWSMKRWGEYVAVVGTSVLLPLEIYELFEKFTPLKLLAFVVNLALVAWLVYSKRLFGVRGGAAAFEEARHGESIMELARAAGGPSAGQD